MKMIINPNNHSLYIANKLNFAYNKLQSCQWATRRNYGTQLISKGVIRKK
jgi:hypothetical protein